MLLASPQVFSQTSVSKALQTRITAWQHEVQPDLAKFKSLRPSVDRLVKILRVPTSNSDAGPYLNAKVSWTDVVGDQNAKAAFDQYRSSVAKEPLLVLPSGIAEKLNAAGKDYLSQSAQFDLKGIDFTWMTKLASFDHWNIEANSPLQFLNPYDFTRSPVPDIAQFMMWWKLRLIKAAQDQKPQAGLAEVLHIAKLLYSTENVLGAMSSLSILRNVANFAEVQKISPPFEPQLIDGAKIFFISYPKFLSPLIDVASFEALTSDANTPGFCEAVAEAGSGFLIYKPLLEKNNPIYPKFAAILQNQKLPCRWEHLRAAWTGHPKYISNFKSLANADLKTKKVAIEALRTTIGADDSKLLEGDVDSPEWAEHLAYVLALHAAAPKALFETLRRFSAK